MIVSLVVTVLNEGETIGRLLDSIANQTRLPDEVVACDGGSADDTVARLNADGSVDTGFTAALNTTVNALAVQADGAE